MRKVSSVKRTASDASVDTVDLAAVRAREAARAAESVVDLFCGQVKQRPDAIALVHGEHHVSYRALDERSARVARALRQRGVAAEVLVGVYLDNSIEAVVAFLSIWKAGGAYVALDPAYPEERLRFM